MCEAKRRSSGVESTELLKRPEGTARVMIVDDDPTTIDLVRQQLASVGYTNLIACGDPAEAMPLVDREAPDVMLLDLVMPSISGLEILRDIRNSTHAAHLPVIVLTAVADRQTKIRALELGATDFLSKPVSFVELAPRVRNALVLKAHQDQLKRYAEDLEHQVELKTGELRDSHFALEKTNAVLRRSCAAAEAATRAKSEFLANVSHEIRTPLTAIIGFSEEMLEQESRQSVCERLEMLRTICRNGRHLLQIVNDILDVSKIENGRLTVERIECSPGEIATDVMRLMRGRAEAKGVNLRLEFVGPIPERIRSDPTRLHQVLVNLVGNAIKFTSAGHVRLVAKVLDQDGPAPLLQFEIVDTGIGIRHDQVAALFQPFTQVDASTARVFGGTGLGLTISKYLVEELGGNIEVESQPGKGSTFRATIATGSLEGVRMLESPGTTAAGRRECRTGTQANSSGKRLTCRVLLAEDSPDNQRFISHVLKKTGVDVVVVGDGQAAYDKAVEAWRSGKPFDLILTDIQMPILDGYQLTRRLRSARYDGRIVAVTANAMSGEREKCLALGCDGYLSKPIDRKELLLWMERVSAERAAATRAGTGTADLRPAQPE